MILCQIEWKIKSLLHHQALVQSANTPLMPAVMDIKNKKNPTRSSRERKHTFEHIMTCWEASCCTKIYIYKKSGKQYKSLMLWWAEWPFFSTWNVKLRLFLTSNCHPTCFCLSMWTVIFCTFFHKIPFLNKRKWIFFQPKQQCARFLLLFNIEDTLVEWCLLPWGLWKDKCFDKVFYFFYFLHEFTAENNFKSPLIIPF